MQLTAARVFSCGVEWGKPVDHFDGVNEFGYVSYWDQIGTIDLGAGLTLPLIIGFQSDRHWSSPYLGDGWILALLDSHIIQRSENAFDMIQPDGYTVPFGRDAKNATILNGAKGWKAEIKGETITAHASCGWTLSFVKGRIASMTTPKNRTLRIQRDSDGVAAEITEGTSVLLKVVRDAKENVVGLRLGVELIGLERAAKPNIQTVQGRNVVTRIDSAVGKITLPDAQIRTFDYAPADDLQPAMTIGGTQKAERRIVWDAEKQLIVSDGPWKYDVKPAEIAGHNAAIGRMDSKKAREFWYYDQSKGQETIETLDETKTIVSWFTSGKLSGKLRKQTITSNHKEHTLQIVYDEDGRMVRTINSDITEIREGNKLIISKASTPQLILTFSSDGSLDNLTTSSMRVRE